MTKQEAKEAEAYLLNRTRTLTATAHERELKQAAVNRAAQHACAVIAEPEANPAAWREKIRQAGRMLQERLNDLSEVDKGDALVASGIRHGSSGS